jgi:tRNA-splicing ligase RtcB
MTRKVKVQKVDENRWRIPREGKMRVEGLVFASEAFIETLRGDPALEQVANVAELPGIVGRSIAMPDIHWGYGFAIGGVAAFSPEDDGVVSPGGVGFDINCGVRLLRSGLSRKDVEGKLRELVETLFANVPTGVGAHRRDFKLSQSELRRVLTRGAGWAVSNGYGTETDLEYIEEGGCLKGANPEEVSPRAIERGRPQLGTLGSGNHFGEIQYVSEIYDENLADALGLFPGQVTVTIHTGSRGLGYQVCDDFLKIMLRASAKYGIELQDRQLCAAPLGSPEGKRYLGAMSAAANYAFANRQMITHWVRETFEKVMGVGRGKLGLGVVYDVCHNIAKFEEHEVGGRKARFCVHRKGATRAFPPGHPQTPQAYRAVGQPVLIPGDMGRYSYVLVGTERAYQETFGSTCHGAGRRMSRRQARKIAGSRPIVKEMEERGIIVRAAGRATLVEEIPEAYKDVAEVVDVVHNAGISRKVAQLRPIGVIKG